MRKVDFITTNLILRNNLFHRHGSTRLTSHSSDECANKGTYSTSHSGCTIITTGHCRICNVEIPKDDVLIHASKLVNKNITCLQTEDGIICPNCVEIFLQLSRKNRAEQKLLSLYSQTMKLYKYCWGQKCYVPNVFKYVHQDMNLGEYKNDQVYSLLNDDIIFRSINAIEIFSNYEETASSIMGVSLPHNIKIPYLNPNIICCPEENFGLIKLPRKNDFVILVKSDFDNICILEQSLNEMSDIAEGKINSRSGAAGGIMLPGNNCRSLSKVTRNERILCARPKSVGMSLSYRNDKGEVKGRSSVYSDLYMTRYDSKSKYLLVLKSVALQRMLVTEMISRLKSFMILDHVGIIPISESILTFLSYDDNRKEMENGFISIGKSLLESKLLSWACCTGEMRNHQSVKTHYDANRSHPVESMSLFGRIPVNTYTLTADYVDSMEAGFLILPLEGVTIKINCGKDLLHCCLKSTVHCADNTRNTCNWSKVHGP